MRGGALQRAAFLMRSRNRSRRGPTGNYGLVIATFIRWVLTAMRDAATDAAE